MKHRLRRLLEHAESREGDWDDRADAWWRVAELASGTGEVSLALEASLRAIDAFRRADQPNSVLNSLNLAQSIALAPSAQSLLKVYRLAALLDLGSLMEAESEAEELLDAVSESEIRPMALDTVAGIYHATGRLQALEELLEEMAQAEGPLAYGGVFRRAQLAALQGDEAAAEAGFSDCIEGLQNHPGSEGAVGAASTELGRLYAVLGRHQDALSAYDRGVEAWEASARRAGQYLTEAHRVLSVVALGGDYVPSALDLPIAFCVDRGLMLIEGQLRLARGICRHKAGREGSREDLSQAVLLPLEQGARLQAGRARLAAANLSGQLEAELARAHRELQWDSLAQRRIESLLQGTSAFEDSK